MKPPPPEVQTRIDDYSRKAEPLVRELVKKWFDEKQDDMIGDYVTRIQDNMHPGFKLVHMMIRMPFGFVFHVDEEYKYQITLRETLGRNLYSVLPADA